MHNKLLYYMYLIYANAIQNFSHHISSFVYMQTQILYVGTHMPITTFYLSKHIMHLRQDWAPSKTIACHTHDTTIILCNKTTYTIFSFHFLVNLDTNCFFVCSDVPFAREEFGIKYI